MSTKHFSAPLYQNQNASIDRFVILGCGGGGRTAVSIIEAACSEQGQRATTITFLDDNHQDELVNGYPVIGPIATALNETGWSKGTGCVVAFGSKCLPARERIFQLLQAKGRHIINAIHPRATIDRTASLGIGNIIAANCVIHPNARLGNNCFLCVAATIDHDNEIGDNVYLSPGVHLAGGVVLEDSVFVGASAAVLPGIRIGKGATVGAGAVVLSDVVAGGTVVGVPARLVEKRKEARQ